MEYERLISVGNLELAWRRINTGRNLQYKRFFRPIYLAYEAGLENNLRLLRRKLLASWQPSEPTRTYLPKLSGLQRPFTLLHLEDQIVLQAVANAFANKLRPRRTAIEHKTVFSNILSEPADSIFFMNRWQETYGEFQKACRQHYEDGYRWVAHFDLAAYYDTISHTQLIHLMSPRGGNTKTWQRVQQWLNKWTTYDGSPKKQHGIPQGPIASNYLGEAYFLPIDEQMSKIDGRYIRYVDDIRLFGRTQPAVQKAAIELELACHSHGLIPQAKKFAIKEAENVNEVLGQLPSIPPEVEEVQDQIPKEIAESIFREALESRPLQVKDKSRLRYVLYRAPKSEKILRWVLKLLPSHPEHIDAFSHYISNYAISAPVVRACNNLLERGIPYGYVRGELWHILARLAPQPMLIQKRPLALNEFKLKGNDIAQYWGLLNFLLRCESEGIGRSSSRIISQHEFIQALLVERLHNREFRKDRSVGKILRQKKLEPSIVLGRELRRRRQSLRDYNLRVCDLKLEVQHIFKGLGIIRRRTMKDRDYVGEILTRLYAIEESRCWKDLLGEDYEYGLQILLEAEAAFELDKSTWLRNQNSFNDMVARAFIRQLKSKGLPGIVRIVTMKGRLVKIGSIVQPGSVFDKEYPIISSAFRNVNNRRNKLPGSHPYDEKGGARNKFLRKAERDKLKGHLRDAFIEIIQKTRVRP